MTGYRLESLNDENATLWEGLNTSSPDGDLFHSLRWKRIVEGSLGITCRYYLLFRDDVAIGLFPFMEHAIRPFRGLIPVDIPISLHTIMQDHTDSFALPFVLQELQRRNRRGRNISFVSFSSLHRKTFDHVGSYTLFSYGDAGDMVLDLSKSPPDSIWSAFSKKKRQELRRYNRDGFVLEEVDSIEELKTFYYHHERNILHIGGTLFPFSYFLELWNTFPEEIRVTLLTQGSLVASGVLLLADRQRKTAHLAILSLNRDLPNTYSPAHYVLWEAVNWAWENHCETVSFGLEYEKDQAGGNPRFTMKNSFGAQFSPVHSMIVPLTNLFAIGIRSKKAWDRWQSGRVPDRAVS